MINQTQPTNPIYTPNLLTRIKSTMIDSVAIVLLMYVATIILDGLGIESGIIRGLAMLIVILYEPICTTVNRTIGQIVMGTRVCKFKELSENGEREAISFPSSVLRFVVKVSLGLVSFMTIHSDADSRAMHDNASGSVMIWENIN
jgi:uncharacterized RDD family membrane protein YckC